MSEQSFSEKMKTCRNRALKAWLHYLGYLCAWAAILLLVLASGVILDNTFVLQPGALYEVLHFVRSNVEIVFCVLLLAGWAVISYFYIARPIRDMELLMESTAALAHPGDTPIRLPESMKNAASATGAVTPASVRAAATIATMLPIVCLYPFLQRYFVTGMTIGGVKE